jgi:hypothetical protein
MEGKIIILKTSLKTHGFSFRNVMMNPSNVSDETIHTQRHKARWISNRKSLQMPTPHFATVPCNLHLHAVRTSTVLEKITLYTYTVIPNLWYAYPSWVQLMSYLKEKLAAPV